MLCEALDTGGVDAVAVEQGFRGAQDPLSSLVVAGWRHAEVVVAVHITGNYTDRNDSYSRKGRVFDGSSRNTLRFTGVVWEGERRHQ